MPCTRPGSPRKAALHRHLPALLMLKHLIAVTWYYLVLGRMARCNQQPDPSPSTPHLGMTSIRHTTEQLCAFATRRRRQAPMPCRIEVPVIAMKGTKKGIHLLTPPNLPRLHPRSSHGCQHSITFLKLSLRTLTHTASNGFCGRCIRRGSASMWQAWPRLIPHNISMAGLQCMGMAGALHVVQPSPWSTLEFYKVMGFPRIPSSDYLEVHYQSRKDAAAAGCVLVDYKATGPLPGR